MKKAMVDPTSLVHTMMMRKKVAGRIPPVLRMVRARILSDTSEEVPPSP
jgi:hypothetical protein